MPLLNTAMAVKTQSISNIHPSPCQSSNIQVISIRQQGKYLNPDPYIKKTKKHVRAMPTLTCTQQGFRHLCRHIYIALYRTKTIKKPLLRFLYIHSSALIQLKYCVRGGNTSGTPELPCYLVYPNNNS